MKTIHVSDEEYTFIRAEATTKGIPDTAYIRSMIVSQVCIEAIMHVNRLSPGTTFELPTLFGADWGKFHASASNIGKAFCDLVCSGSIADVKIIGKGGSSGNMQYERL